MSLRPEALRGAGSGTHVAGQVDYRLARNVIVSEFRKGRLSRLDVCDAHPELAPGGRERGRRDPGRLPDLRGGQGPDRVLRVRPQAAPFGRVRHVEGGNGQAGPDGQGPHLLRGRGVPRLLVEPPGPQLRHQPSPLACSGSLYGSRRPTSVFFGRAGPAPAGPGRPKTKPGPGRGHVGNGRAGISWSAVAYGVGGAGWAVSCSSARPCWPAVSTSCRGSLCRRRNPFSRRPSSTTPPATCWPPSRSRTG